MKKWFLTLTIILSVISAKAQYANIMISDHDDPEEPSIMINPKNTNEIVAGANINKYYCSKDAGHTWTEGTLTSSYGVWGDPCIIVDTAGSFYFFHLSNPYQGNWIDRIVCQKATVIGGAWNDGSYTWLDGAKAQDKEWAVVDRNNNNIYVSWTQFDKYGSANPADSSVILFSRSADGGQNWSAAKRINKTAGDCIDSYNTAEGAVPTVGPNGEVYVSWAGPAGIRFNKSYDAGNTWLANDIFVSDQPGGWDYSIPGIQRCNGLPVTDCDRSNSPYKGNIYINWSDQRNGATDTDVWLSKSTDGGNTWSAPKRVNDDTPGKQQFFTWMAVDQANGFLYFVFYDRRNYSDNRTDVYMAVSKDGGESFFNFKISDSPFIPNQNVFFGDYTNISAYNNVVRPVWARYDAGVLSVWTAIVDSVIIDVKNYAGAGDFSLEQNNPNPFVDNTYIGFKLQRKCNVSLKVFDVYGRETATLIDNEYYHAGKYIRHFDAAQCKIPSGLYYFSLISNEKILTRKMMLIK